MRVQGEYVSATDVLSLIGVDQSTTFKFFNLLKYNCCFIG